MNKNIPAVSIVIPMYNAEKYIGDCLYNILIQTFQDFEVIVVDDCSTDRSCEVVESYLPEFNVEGEKLKLLRRSFNSGAPGIPNNMGLNISRGEYISFLEADDFIKTTTYEELYPIAKKFDADVVHCEKYFQFIDGQDTFEITGYENGEFVKEPTLITENLAERVQDLYNKKFLLNVWTKLIRRDFIAENDLKMIDANAHDAIYTCCLICTAKRYVRVPNVVNFYRIVENSMSHIQENIPKTIKKWLKTLTKGFDYLEHLLSKREFYQKNPDVKYLALEIWVKECVQYLLGIYQQVQPFQLDEIIRHELSKVQDKTGLMAFLFSRMNVFDVNIRRKDEIIYQQNKIIQQLQEQVKKLQQN